jgi:hypothetical protein
LTTRGRWDAQIEAEISVAHVVLVLWTPHSISSDWVRAEATFARRDQR